MPFEQPVFYDPGKKRWPRVRVGFVIAGSLLTLILGILLFSILFDPAIQSLALPVTSQNRHFRPAEQKFRQEKRALSSAVKVKDIAPESRGTTPLSAGFLVAWDPASAESLKQHIGNLNMVLAEWLHLKADGSLAMDNEDQLNDVLNFTAGHKPSLKMMVLINNYANGSWQTKATDDLLANTDARAALIQNLLTYTVSHKLAGVTIDFENISRRDDLYSFIKELSDAFHAKGLLVGVNVPSDNNAFDYVRLASAADYVNLMMYDEHWATSQPGPISGLDWFTNVLAKRAGEIPPSKMMVSLGNYAYDWRDEKGSAESLTFSDALTTAAESEGDVTLDPATLDPAFDYYDDANALHHVWMLDAVTFFNELALLQKFHPYGVSLWRLGSEDPALWNVFGKTPVLDAKAASSMENISAEFGLDYEGKGEILSASSTAHVGHRDLSFDTGRGLITSEHYTAFPAPYVITRYGAAGKKIALTFDDGPDPTYTPQILDILAAKHVIATFFVVGSNAERYPELVEREFDVGNEIGNHTFTHPNIAEISPLQLRLELSATDHLIASITGRDTHLFRPPYAVDAEPDTVAEARPLEIAASLGYVSVGMQLDPEDWSRPGTAEIVNRVVSDAESGKGNIVLLHDSGGDRSETVAALPEIIDTLQADGFTLVPVSALLQKTRNDVMTPAETGLIGRSGSALGFQIITSWETILAFLFALGIILGLFHFGLVLIFALWQRHRQPASVDFDPSVAVIVPCYNEGKVVVRTIASLLAADHPNRFEIVAVDDGSTDDTWEVLQRFAQDPMVRVVRKENGGKASALNEGLRHTAAEIVISLDADTIFAKDTIRNLVRHFADPRVGAVAGNTKVGNRVNILTRWQALEYITSQNLDRRAFEILNSITVVPGAVGAWRREAVERAGGWSRTTLAEDADLTLNVRQMNYKIIYDDTAIALTEAPETFHAFLRQRFRWTYGTLQVIRKHLRMIFNPRYGLLGFFVIPYMLLYQVVFPFLGPVIDLITFGSLAFAGISKLFHPDTFSPAGIDRLLFFYALFLLLDLVTAGVALLIEKDEDKTLLAWLFFQRFVYRQLMYYVAIKSVIAAVRGGAVGWDKLERKGSVPADGAL